MSVAIWVLIIDDDIDELRSLTQMLFSTNIHVSSAKSSHIAFTFLKKYHPDVIVLKNSDDAFATLHTICTDSHYHSIPVLFLLDKEETTIQEHALKKGAAKTLCLPVSDQEFVKQVMQCTSSSQASSITEKVASQVSTSYISNTSLSPEGDITKIEGIDYTLAVHNCGGEDIFEEALSEFYKRIEEKADQIEQCFNQRDWKNYTIFVHSLKSSARLIGAMQLSDFAKTMEHCGDIKDEETIDSKTPELLSLFRSYHDKLLPYFTKQMQLQVSVDQNKPLITDKELQSAFSGLKECVSISDFDSADFIMNSLSQYQIPSEQSECIELLKKAVSDVNQDKVLQILEKIGVNRNDT